MSEGQPVWKPPGWEMAGALGSLGYMFLPPVWVEEDQKLRQLFRTETLLCPHHIPVSHIALSTPASPETGDPCQSWLSCSSGGTPGVQQQGHSSALRSSFPPTVWGAGRGQQAGATLGEQGHSYHSEPSSRANTLMRVKLGYPKYWRQGGGTRGASVEPETTGWAPRQRKGRRGGKGREGEREDGLVPTFARAEALGLSYHCHL